MTVPMTWEFTGFVEHQGDRSLLSQDLQDFEQALWRFTATCGAAHLTESELALPFTDDATQRRLRVLEHHHQGTTHASRAFLQSAMLRLHDVMDALDPPTRARLWFTLGLAAFYLGHWYDADDAFAACARALPPQAALAQQLQLAYYWGRAALYGQRPQQALLSFQQFLTLWHSASAPEIAAAVPHASRSLVAYLHVQIARTEHDLERLHAACAHDVDAITLVNGWVQDHRLSTATMLRPLPGSVPLRELPPEMSHSTAAEDLPWLALAVMAPWYYINHAAWEVRLNGHHGPKDRLSQRTWQPMRVLLENAALRFGAKSREALHLHLHAVDLALSGVSVAERASAPDEANIWLVRAAHYQHAIDQSFKIGHTDPQYNYWRLLRNEIWFREYVRADNALAATQIVTDIEQHRDHLHQDALHDLEAHAERLLGHCYSIIKPEEAAAHFRKALELFQHERPPHLFSPHCREIEQTLRQHGKISI
jgi:tetratricopeptide (TPR) repeat protein